MEGTWRNGSWAEKMLVPTENAVPLDERRLLGELGYAIPQLCWINEFLVPFGGFSAAGFRAGSTVIVAPAFGHFGGCAVRMGVALAQGRSTVVAVARNEKSLSRVKEMDSKGRVETVVLSGDVERDSTAIRAATPACKGADLYIDFSPPQAAKASHPQACVSALKHGGQAVLMGGVREDLRLNYEHIMLTNIIIRGTFMYPLQAPYQMLGLVESGQLDFKSLNTATFGMDDLQKGIDFSKKHSGMADLTVLTVST